MVACISSDAAVRVLALMIGCDGQLDTHEMDALHDLDAYRRIGVSKERFGEFARECLREFGGSRELSWIPAGEEARVDGMLDAVADPQQRRLVCELASAALRRDGHHKEHLLLDHVLAHWHIDRAALNQPLGAASR